MSMKKIAEAVWGEDGVVQEQADQEKAAEFARTAMALGFDESIDKVAAGYGYKKPAKKAEKKAEVEKTAGDMTTEKVTKTKVEKTKLSFEDIAKHLTDRFTKPAKLASEKTASERFNELLKEELGN